MHVCLYLFMYFVCFVSSLCLFYVVAFVIIFFFLKMYFAISFFVYVVRDLGVRSLCMYLFILVLVF